MQLQPHKSGAFDMDFVSSQIMSSITKKVSKQVQ